MVDPGRVVRLLRGIDDRVVQLTDRRDEGGQSSPLWLDAVKYAFVVAIEGCIDVGQHIAASEGWAAPDTNAAVFKILARHGVIDDEVAVQLGLAVGFRNLLVHQYADVDDGRVVGALDRLSDLQAFTGQVRAWMNR